MSTFDYIYRAYGVRYKRGMRVTVDGKPGTVVGVKNCYIRVKFDDRKFPVNCHPTWKVKIVGEDAS